MIDLEAPVSTKDVDPKIFKSRIDGWLVPVLALIPVFSVGVLVDAVVRQNTVELWIALGSILFVVALFRGLVFPMRYELHATEIVVRFGFLRWSAPYTKIREVSYSRNPLSAPALSLRRLRLDTGEGLSTYISPRDRKAFLDALADRAGHLEFDGPERLISRGG